MTTRLTLVCHASTRATREVRFAADEALDEAGAASAERLAPSFRARAGAFACCAPSTAARQTAARLGLAPAVEPELRDQDMGAWRGLSLADVHQRHPEDVGRWLSDPAGAPHGGESVVALIRRVTAWLVQQPDEGRAVIAVTHPAVIRAVLVAAVTGTAESFWRFDVAPLSCTELRGHEGRWNLRSFGGR